MTPWMFRAQEANGRPVAWPWASAAAVIVSFALSACGGGDGGGKDQLDAADADVVTGPACADCVPGHVVGVVTAGEPMRRALVRVFDASGASVSGATDGEGRFKVDVAGLRGPFLVQAEGTIGGQPLVLHNVVRAQEAGRRFTQVTPLTELIAARVLGGAPSDLIVQGRVDPWRISASAVAASERQIRAAVRPLMDWAEAGDVDLRLSPAQPEGRGLNKVLGVLVLVATGQGPGLRTVWQAPDSALAGDTGIVAEPTPSQEAAWHAASEALPRIQADLDALAALFANGLPDAALLQPRLRQDFLHAGLDRSAYIDRVLRRRDPAQRGGFSLEGVRFTDPRLMQVVDADKLLVRIRVVPREPFEPFDETLWMVREGQDWRWLGDGALARLRVRHAHVLTARPMAEGDIRSLPGMACAEASPCLLEGGQSGVPTGGFLDYGFPGRQALAGDHFGLLALCRLDAPLAEDRLAAYAAQSRFLGVPSGEIRPYLLFELDARQSDPRAVRAVVQGPGLPASGLTLRRPSTMAGLPDADHWAWPADGSATLATDDWNGIPAQWCEGSANLDCEAVWSAVGAGSRFTVSLFDGQDRLLGQVASSLPPPAMALRPQSARPDLLSHFAMWRLQDGEHLTLDRLLGASSPLGDVLELDAHWQRPTADAHRVVGADLAWHRAGFPPFFGLDAHRERVALPSADGQGAWRLDIPARTGFRSTWLVLRLTSTDLLGNRFIHAVAPSNPR